MSTHNIYFHFTNKKNTFRHWIHLTGLPCFTRETAFVTSYFTFLDSRSSPFQKECKTILNIVALPEGLYTLLNLATALI